MNEQGKFIKKVADCLAVILIIMIIGGVLGATGVLTSVIPADSYSSPSEKTAFYADNVDELDVEVACADISFVTADSLYIEADTDCFRIKTKGEKITVEEKETFLKLNKSRKLTVYIPEDFVFEKVSLEMGASTLDAESLKTNRLELDTGAGHTEFESLEVTGKADIDCGAGEVTVKNSAIHSLDFSLGVGSANITAQINGGADIESGVGELNLSLKGGKDKYCFDIETGLGSIVFDGAAVKKDTLLGNGETKIQLEGGVGSLNVSFPTE